MDSKGVFLKFLVLVLIFYFLFVDDVSGGSTTPPKSTSRKASQARSSTKITSKKPISKTTTKKENVKTSTKKPNVTTTTQKKPAIASGTKLTSKKPPSGGIRRSTTTKNPLNNTRFARYRRTYQRMYTSSGEEQAAAQTYQQTSRENDIHNSNPNKTYTRGDTPDTDRNMSWVEQHRMGIRKPDQPTNVSSVLPRILTARMDYPDYPDYPEEADWSAWFPPVKDQSDCGACWAFAANGVLEYMQNVIYENYSLISEQELIDCNSDSMDCYYGGWPTHAYNYMIDYGISSSDNYPYLAYKADCVAKHFRPALYLAETYEMELDGDEEQLKKMVYDYGPVVVVYYVTRAFTQYKDGVFTDPNNECPPGDYNHAFIITGYGVDDQTGLDYWLIRNSWGTRWGKNGYGKIQRGVNLCAIGLYAMLPSRINATSPFE